MLPRVLLDTIFHEVYFFYLVNVCCADYLREFIRVALYEAVGEPVEGMDPNTVPRLPRNLYKSLAHRKNTGLGKGESEDIFRRGVGEAEDIRNPERQNLCLPRPGPGDDHNWPFYGINRFFLRGIEFFIRR